MASLRTNNQFGLSTYLFISTFLFIPYHFKNVTTWSWFKESTRFWLNFTRNQWCIVTRQLHILICDFTPWDSNRTPFRWPVQHFFASVGISVYFRVITSVYQGLVIHYITQSHIFHTQVLLKYAHNNWMFSITSLFRWIIFLFDKCYCGDTGQIWLGCVSSKQWIYHTEKRRESTNAEKWVQIPTAGRWWFYNCHSRGSTTLLPNCS